MGIKLIVHSWLSPIIRRRLSSVQAPSSTSITDSICLRSCSQSLPILLVNKILNCDQFKI
jgi:hypothetical protein